MSTSGADDLPLDVAAPGPAIEAAAAAVANAEARLAELAGQPTADHVEVYEQVHAELQRALTALDEA